MDKIYYAGNLASIEAEFISFLAGRPQRDPLQARIVLCASHLLAGYLRRQIALQGCPAFNLRFHTFDTLAAELLPLDYQKTKLISPLGELTLLKSIVRSRSGYFSPVHDKDGFLFALLATIQDLIDADIRQIPAPAQKSEKLKDLARILEAFRAAVEPFISRAEALRIATRNLQRFTEVFDSDSLTVYGFYDFTVLQKLFLVEASRRLGICAFLPSGRGEAAGFTQPTLDFLAAQGFQRGDLSAREAGGSGGIPAAGDLRRLQSFLFVPLEGSRAGVKGQDALPSAGITAEAQGTQKLRAAGVSAESPRRAGKHSIKSKQIVGQGSLFEKQAATPEKADGSVLIISARDEHEEVMAIGRQIQRLARQGIDFSEIAVLLRNPEVYSQLIEDIFKASGIPYYLQSGTPLSQSHPAKALLLLLELLAGDLPRFEVIEFASFAPLNWRSLLAPEKPSDSDLHVSPSAWNRLSAEAGVVAGLQSWNKRLEALQSKLSEDFARWQAVPKPAGSASSAATRRGQDFHQRVNTFQISKLLEFLNVLDQWKRKFQACRAWSDFSEVTKEAIDLFFYRSGSDPADGPQVWDQLLAVVDAIATLDQVDTDASLKRWISALRETLENDRVRSGRFQSGGVSVLSVMGSRATRHRVVLVPGMAEKGFPLLSRQDSILLDWERSALNEAASAALPLKSMRTREEKLLFHLCVGAARERLVLTLPRLETQGSRSRLPSHYLIGAAEALTGEPQDFETLEKLPQFDRVALSELAPEEFQDALTENQFALRALRDPAKVPASLYQNVLERSLSAYRARWSHQFTPHDGLIQSDDLVARIREWAQGRRLSPSALELFAFCSYKFFLKQLLGLERTEEPEEIETISALDKGDLVHRVLDTFMRRAQSLQWFPLTTARAPEVHELMDEIADKVFSETEGKGITGYPLLWELTSERIRADLHAFVEREIDRRQHFTPDRFEVEFGRGESPVELKLPGGHPLNLSGRIDRIDFNDAGTAVRVVDYKTGKNRLDESAEFQAGQKLQLAIYLMAAAQMYGLKDLEASLAEYYYVSSDGEFTIHSFTGEDWQAKLERLTKLLSTIHGALMQGLFPADPGVSGDHCTICDFTLICDKAVQRIHGFKSRSPLLEFKRELQKFE